MLSRLIYFGLIQDGEGANLTCFALMAAPASLGIHDIQPKLDQAWASFRKSRSGTSNHAVPRPRLS
eukprot:251282-Karenia_brevis.AAC.1